MARRRNTRRSAASPLRAAHDGEPGDKPGFDDQIYEADVVDTFASNIRVVGRMQTAIHLRSEMGLIENLHFGRRKTPPHPAVDPGVIPTDRLQRLQIPRFGARPPIEARALPGLESNELRRFRAGSFTDRFQRIEP